MQGMKGQRWSSILQEDKSFFDLTSVITACLLYYHFYVTAGIYCLLSLLESHGDMKLFIIPNTNPLIAQAKSFIRF